MFVQAKGRPMAAIERRRSIQGAIAGAGGVLLPPPTGAARVHAGESHSVTEEPCRSEQSAL